MTNEEILVRAWEAGASNAPFSTDNLGENLAEAVKTAWVAGSHNMPYNPKKAAEALGQ